MSGTNLLDLPPYRSNTQFVAEVLEHLDPQQKTDLEEGLRQLHNEPES